MKLIFALGILLAAATEGTPSKAPTDYADPLVEEAIKQITVVSDEWCPYACDPKADAPGYMVEITQEIFGNQGISVKYKLIPWERAVAGTEKGDYDSIIGIAHPESKTIIFPKNELGISVFSFFTNADSSWRYNGVKSLNGVTLGAVEGYSYMDAESYIQSNKDNNLKVQIIKADGALDKNVKKLMSNRITALLEDQYVVSYYLKQNNLRGKISHAGNLRDKYTEAEDYVYLAFSPKTKNYKQLVKIFDEGIKKMRETGRLKEILNKYGITDWKTSKISLW